MSQFSNLCFMENVLIEQMELYLNLTITLSQNQTFSHIIIRIYTETFNFSQQHTSMLIVIAI